VLGIRSGWRLLNIGVYGVGVEGIVVPHECSYIQTPMNRWYGQSSRRSSMRLVRFTFGVGHGGGTTQPIPGASAVGLRRFRLSLRLSLASPISYFPFPSVRIYLVTPNPLSTR
jgi:hypothetical protein